MPNLFNKLLTTIIIAALIATVFAALPSVTQLSYSPTPAVPGTTMTVLVQVENLDSTAQTGVSVQLENIYPFEVKTSDLETNPRSVGDIGAYGKALAQFTIYVDPAAENKTYNLPITITTKGDPSGVKVLEPIIIGGKEPTIKVVATSGDKLLPGEEKEITFTLQNVGTGTAYDIILEMQEDRTITATGTVVERDITPLGAATAYLASLNPGEQKQVTLKVSVNSTATIKNYTQPIKISYRNAAGTRTTDTSYIGLNVAGLANIDASLKEKTGSTLPGQNASVTIELFNKGLGKAEFLLVELSAKDGIADNPKQFIGSLGPNDVDTVSTNVTYTTAGEHSLIATITYLDSDSITKTVTISVPITGLNTTSEGINPWIIVVIIVVIVLLVWNFKFRNKKKK